MLFLFGPAMKTVELHFSLSGSNGRVLRRLSRDSLSEAEQVFHTNLNSKMCYLEDVFHSRCGHWAEQARVYHTCAAAGPQVYCSNKKKCGSVNEDSLCRLCRTCDKNVASNQGKWLKFLVIESVASNIFSPCYSLDLFLQ